MNTKANQALEMLTEFYEYQEKNSITTESEDIRQVILLEFAGLINGPEGRVKQALKNDKIVKVALDILSDKLVYESSLIPSVIKL
jgi:hypothetical protein